MTDQIISFDTARLAKQKGFHWPCSDCYEVDIEPWYHHTVNSPVDYNGASSLMTGKSSRRVFSAPTQSLLQKWLRDRYKIDIEITVWTDPETKEKFYESDLYSDIVEEETESEEDYPSYEEALESALKEALKLIKNVTE